jgi:AcrR family transcriptional regulator
MAEKQRPYRDRMRDKLLAIAEDILEREGLGQVQARRVAQDAGCAIGTVYNIFGDLDGLVVAANARTLEGLGVELQVAVQATAGGTPRERLMALALTYLGFALKSRLRWKAVFDHKMSDDHPVPPAYRRDQSRLLALIEDALRSSIDGDAAQTRASRALFAAVHGIVALAIERTLGAFDRDETEAQVRFLIDAVSRGLSPGEP